MPDDTPSRTGGLAARFKAAIEERRAQARRAREAEQRRREEAERARRELLRELTAFGRAIGHFDVASKRDRVSFRFEGRGLYFEAADDGQVKVSGDELAGSNTLFIQAPLNKWVWSHKPRRGPERRVMLFDQGLEALVAQALKIEPAGDTPERSAR